MPNGGIIDPWGGYRRGKESRRQSLEDMARNKLALQKLAQDERRIGQAGQRLQMEGQRIGLEAQRLQQNKMKFLIDAGAPNEAVSAFYNTQIKQPGEPEINFERKGSFKYQIKQGNKLITTNEKTGEVEVEDIPGLEGRVEEEEREFRAKKREAEMMSAIRQREKRALKGEPTLKEQEGLYNSIIDDARQHANIVVPKAGAGFSFGEEGVEFTGGDRDIEGWQKAHDDYLRRRVNQSVDRNVLSEKYRIEEPEVPEVPGVSGGALLGEATALRGTSGQAPELREIDEETARSILDEAGGSVDRAREIAKGRGFKF